MKFTKLFLALALLSTQTQAETQASIWSGYRGNPAHTGYVDTKTNPSKFKVLWHKTDFSGYIPDTHEMTLANHLLYFSIWNPSIYTAVYAVNPDTGKTVWHTELPETTDISSVLYGNGKVMVTVLLDDGEQGSQVAAFDATNGHELYTIAANISGVNLFQTPLVVGNSMLVIDHSNLYNFNIDTHTLNWNTTAGVGFATASTNYIFCGTNAGIIDVVDQKDGSKTFIKAPENNFSSYDMTWDEKNNALYATFNSSSGTARITQLTAYDFETRLVKWNIVDDQIKKVVATGNAIYYSNKESTLKEVNPVTGKITWTWKMTGSGNIVDSLATNDVLFVSIEDEANHQSRTLAFSLKTHEIIWQINMVANLSADENHLYLDDHEGLTAVALN